MKMRLSLMVLMMVSLLVSDAEAQLFGERSVGQPLSRRTRPQAATPEAMETAGTLEGDERFLRENRSRNDYVGSNRGSLQGFVGSEQAIGTGRVRTSVESLREPPNRAGQINRPFPQIRPGEMYYPRLDIDVSDMADASYISAVALKRDAKLQSLLSQTAESDIVVFHQGDRTVLRGIVASEAMAEKLRILASFEPHINNIESQLVVGQIRAINPEARSHNRSASPTWITPPNF
ncbi:hypothetical protein CA13_22740 [Planctomycetes bacterium CA13]|uniref:BON domain protein n=1 Tax=Novipirellula herctigrandis TaxID=2527986 RepID=A0A5C5Z0C5_9BACT|nr:hypothetical protein CA13_22740 [Planctomycetes bacterium CA13]